jgi:hypothetical protein
MPTGRRNQQSILFSVRLPLALSAQVDAYASAHDLPRNQAFADLVKRGLNSDTLSNTPSDTPENTLSSTPGNTPQIVAALEERLTRRIEVLEARIDLMSKPQDMKRTAHIDETKHFLGALCERNHVWQNSGQTRRSKRNGGCMECEAEKAREKRARGKVAVQADLPSIDSNSAPLASVS